ncbi:hypothetical protein LWC34_41830 [Kibdelosporangium philippinense]|uniref:Uncharacterized protein n=1 Tax=Kibdelosporangium philippinense TaxID=211113 RepID=A0ABS8ZRT5_9PSEU|nr:hypothetical protein [Kibdelosporangium philippinense]MCE7009311.1 hypothetical protein [Kibdelosporangium philippinense]
MSLRARHARRLASLLTMSTGVHVIVQYQRDRNHYRVVWAGGPAVEVMRELAVRCVAEVPTLDLIDLDWSRAEA